MNKSLQRKCTPIPPEVEAIGKKVLDAAYAVHTALGPGLLEFAYEACLAHKLRQENVLVETQVVVPVMFDGVQIETGLRLDLLAGKLVIVELKSVETMIPLYEAQLLTSDKCNVIAQRQARGDCKISPCLTTTPAETAAGEWPLSARMPLN